MPDYATVARWLAERDGSGVNPLCEQYARAKEAQADFMAEELAELHNKAWVPVIDAGTGEPVMLDGRPVMTVDRAAAAIVRLESDNKKWLMGKLKPKRFGDKVMQEHTGADGGPIKARIAVEFVRPPARDEDDAA